MDDEAMLRLDPLIAEAFRSQIKKSSNINENWIERKLQYFQDFEGQLNHHALILIQVMRRFREKVNGYPVD